jgi:hypothetical protein
VTELGPLEGDARAGSFAFLSAGLGAVGVTTLATMYAVEVPRDGPYVFGAINDFTGGLFFLSSIPVVVQVHRRLGEGRGTTTSLWTVVGLSVAAAGSGVLLAFHVIPFTPSTAVTIGAITGHAVWFAAVHHKLLGRGGYPRGLARLGLRIGVSMLAGLSLVLGGLAAGDARPLRLALLGAGGLLGAGAWTAWPFWYYRAGQALRGHVR